jgi:glycosyltransferase involved in cell wall biosynthesis
VLYDDSLAQNPAGSGTVARGLLAALQRQDGLEIVVSEFGRAAVASIDVARKTPASRALNALAHFRYFGLELPARARQAGCDVIFSPSSLGPLRGTTPAVITIHDLSPLRYASTFHWVNRIYLQGMLRWQLRRSAAISTGTQAVRGELLERFRRLRADHVYVVPDAPDPALLEATPTAVAGIDGEFFLMVGTIEPRKNHVTAIRALAACLERRPTSNLSLVIAGSPGWRYQPVLDTIRSLGLESRVLRLGRVDAGRLHWLYRHARALLFPSIYEGFGIPPLEAFALSCSVIASRIDAVVEVAGESTTTLVDPLDVPGWANALEAAASTPPDSSRIARARERARQYTWENSAKTLRDALVAAT